MHRLISACLGLVIVTAGPWAAAIAADYEVQMLTRDSEGRAMQFEPAYLRIEPGDTVTFLTTNPGHNSESIPDMLPEGATPWKGRINEEITVTFEVEGTYAYKCLPHFPMGMVGIIQVGEGIGPSDEAVTVRLPKRAKERIEELMAESSEDAESAD